MRCPGCGHDNLPGEDLCAECGFDLAGLDVDAWGVDPDDPILNLPVSSLPLKEPLVLRPSATAAEAIALMAERHEGCVFATDERGQLLGVFTERDVASRIAASGKDPSRVRLEEVMTPSPATLHKTDPLAWALHRMGVDGHRHLPVLENGRLVGFLSIRTVLKTLLD
jgi:CBS domain-containing protein